MYISSRIATTPTSRRGGGTAWAANAAERNPISRPFYVFRDLYDLRDLDHVFWVGSVRSSSYTHVFPGWDLYDLALTHMFFLDGICMI